MLDSPRQAEPSATGVTDNATVKTRKAPSHLRMAAIVAVVAAVGAAAWWARGLLVPEVSVVSPTRGNAAEVVYATGVVEPKGWTSKPHDPSGNQRTSCST